MVTKTKNYNQLQKQRFTPPAQIPSLLIKRCMR